MEQLKEMFRRKHRFLALFGLSLLYYFVFFNVPSSTLRTALSLPLLMPVERLQASTDPIVWTTAVFANSILWGTVMYGLGAMGFARYRRDGRLIPAFLRTLSLSLWLTLVVAFVAVWIDSYRYELSLSRGSSGYAAVNTGSVYLLRNVGVNPDRYTGEEWRGWHWSPLQSSGWPIQVITDARDGKVHSRWGFAYCTIRTWDNKSKRHAVIFPCWSAFVLLVSLPIPVVLVSRLRRRRVREGFCVGCGYDLRASPDRCPECGLTPPSRRL